MTFKGMLKILVKDYHKQHEQKFHSIVNELLQTRRELREAQVKIQNLEVGDMSSSSSIATCANAPTIRLFVQYNGFFNQLCDICQTITVRELKAKLRHVTGIATDRPLRIRVLSEHGLTTLFFLDEEPDRTLDSYDSCLKPRMILSIEDQSDDDDDDEKNHSEATKSTTSSDRTFSFDESSV